MEARCQALVVQVGSLVGSRHRRQARRICQTAFVRGLGIRPGMIRQQQMSRSGYWPLARSLAWQRSGEREQGTPRLACSRAPFNENRAPSTALMDRQPNLLRLRGFDEVRRTKRVARVPLLAGSHDRVGGLPRARRISGAD